jgi:hypothetical protein
MNAIRYLLLADLAFMALAAVAIFVYRILSTSSARLEVGGVVPYLSILGVLAFLIGSGLVVYDNHRYQGLGLGLAGLGWLAIVGSFFIARWKSQRMP